MDISLSTLEFVLNLELILMFITLTVSFISLIYWTFSFGYKRNIKDFGVFSIGVLFFILFLIFSYFYNKNLNSINILQGNQNHIDQITKENNIYNVHTFSFSDELAHKIDFNVNKNAKCENNRCVYDGSVYIGENGLVFKLFSQPKISFNCTVENNCKVDLVIDNEIKYLKVDSNY